MKILIIAPIPPPYHGNSIPVKYLIEAMKGKCELIILNTNHNSMVRGNIVLRFIKVLSILCSVIFYRNSVDKVYLSLAESTLGNLRDIIISQILPNKNGLLVLQLLGGGNLKTILSAENYFRMILNKKLFQKADQIIVEGRIQASMFTNIVGEKRISILNNFAPDEMYLDELKIKQKFLNIAKINIVFISNFIKGKGYLELMHAYLRLPDEYKSRVNLEFAGQIVDDEEYIKDFFLKNQNIRYHGFINLSEKVKLFQSAHVFCLPTYYVNEGQPFSIVEAYAAGCGVITTMHSGIPAIFQNEVNGYSVEPKNVLALRDCIIKAVENSQRLLDFAVFNYRFACQNRRDAYYSKMIKILCPDKE